MAEEVPFRGLHPLSVLVNLVPRAWSFGRRSWPVLVAILYGRSSGQGLADLLLVSVLFMGTVGSTLVHFLTLSYRVEGGRLEIRTGLLHRQTRVIAAERIQNTELVRDVFHRMAGLVEVRVETASGREVEGLLSALSQEDAEELVAALDRARALHKPAPQQELATEMVVRNRTPELISYGVTGARFGAIVLAFGLILQLLSWGDPEQMQGIKGLTDTVGTVALVAASVSGAWFLSILTTMLRHHGFDLRLEDGVLVAEEGLFTRRRVLLSQRKIQVVTVVEPWLRRLFGFCSVQVETAAARVEGDGTQRAEAVVPVVQSGDQERVLRRILRRSGAVVQADELLPPAPQALTYGVVQSLLRVSLVAGLLVWWFWPWGLVAMVLWPWSALLAWLDVRFQGWRVGGELVVAREGYLTRRTRVMPRGKLQSSDLLQGPLLRSMGLGRLVLRVAGGSVSLPVLGFERCVALQEELVGALRAVAPASPAESSPAEPSDPGPGGSPEPHSPPALSEL